MCAHADAVRQPLLLKKTLPSDWNGLMRLSLSGAAAYWTPTGGVPIVLGSTVFTNAQLPQTIYLMGDGCGTGQASFSVVGLPDCATNIPLQKGVRKGKKRGQKRGQSYNL